MVMLPALVCPPCFGATEYANLEQIERRLQAIEDGNIEEAAEIWDDLQAMKPLLKAAPISLQTRHSRLQCWYFDGPYEQGIQAAIELLTSARQGDDIAAIADYQICLGYHYYLDDQYDRAVSELTEGLDLALTIPDHRLVADATYIRGELYGLRGELALSLADFITAQRHYERHGVPYWIFTNLSALANSYRQLGEFTRALELYHTVQRSAHFDVSDLHKIENFNQIGLVYEDLEQPQKALDFYQTAAKLAETIQASEALALSHFYMGGVLSDLGRYQEALTLLQDSVTEQITEDRASLAVTEMYIAKALLGLGNYDQALHKIQQAETFFRNHQSQRQLSLSLKLHAEALAAKGDWQAAYQKQRAYQDAKAELEKIMRQQQGLRIQAEYEAERKENENLRLSAEQEYQAQQLAALTEAKYWRTLVIVLVVLLLILAIALGFSQLLRARRYDRMAHTDELTGVANRRFIMRLARKQFTLAQKQSKSLSIALFDADHFKAINDRYGHDTGDRMLQHLCQASQSALRQLDMLGRFGGEEFMVVLPNTDMNQARMVAQRIRDSVAKSPLRINEDSINITISLGIAQQSECDQDLPALLSRADKALYKAQQNGRNRVEAAS